MQIKPLPASLSVRALGSDVTAHSCDTLLNLKHDQGNKQAIQKGRIAERTQDFLTRLRDPLREQKNL